MRRKRWGVIPAVEPLRVPAFVGRRKWNGKIVPFVFELDPDFSNHSGFGFLWLGLEVKKILEERKERGDSQESFEEMNKNTNLEDSVRIEVHQLDLIEGQEVAEELT